MSTETTKPLVSIIMGSKSDLTVMQGSMDVLAILKVPYEVDIISAHRTPRKMYSYAEGLYERGVCSVIAGAGGAAHLPGMVASITILPVVGVPISATKLAGIDSLLSIAQMPVGVPVATVAIDNAENAALLATQILMTKCPEYVDRLKDYRLKLEAKVEAASATSKSVHLP